MAIKNAAFARDHRFTVTRMTLERRRLGGIATAAVVVAIASGCSGAAAPAEGASGDRPDSASIADGGTDAKKDGGELPPEPPPPPLCALAGPPTSTPGDVLVFSEEFDGAALDPLKWNVVTGYKGHGGIANSSAASNAVVRDGTLEITTERNESDSEHPYVSGWIDNVGKYARTYGKIEMRARFPSAAGVWYAVWGRPWSQSFPEIDIEIVNRPADPVSHVYFVNHWAAPPLAEDDRRSFVMFKQDVSELHTYTVLWKPGSLEWQIDGVTKMQAQPRGVPDLPVHWIINGWVGGWVGNPTTSTPFPNTFALDYFRVYRVDGVVADPLVRVNNARTKYARKDSIVVSIANYDEACAHVEMYDGERLTRTTSTPPFKFALSALTPGPHKLTFVATDGVRRTTTSVETTIQ